METILDHKLRRGSIVLTLEPAETQEKLHFDARFDTDHAADVLFEQIVQGFVDSDKSWAWPLLYERTPEPLLGDLHVGKQFRMGYSIPRWEDPLKTLPEVVYNYRLTNFSREDHIFEYEGIGHDMAGGGLFHAATLSPTASRFEWRGAYQSEPGNEKVHAGFKRYLPVLFEAFESCVESGPGEVHQTQRLID
ncbi:MAG: hypothetical protein AAF515_13305 [Pseudomonadota bacterium]